MAEAPSIQEFMKTLAESAQAQSKLITRIGQAIEQIAESQHAQQVLLATLFESHPDRTRVLELLRRHVATQSDEGPLRKQLEILVGPLESD